MNENIDVSTVDLSESGTRAVVEFTASSVAVLENEGKVRVGIRRYGKVDIPVTVLYVISHTILSITQQTLFIKRSFKIETTSEMVKLSLQGFIIIFTVLVLHQSPKNLNKIHFYVHVIKTAFCLQS